MYARAFHHTTDSFFFLSGFYVWVCQRTSKQKKSIYIECRHIILLLLLLCRRLFLHLLRKWWLLLILGVDIMKCDRLVTCNSHHPLSHSLSFENDTHDKRIDESIDTIDKHLSCSVQLANFTMCHLICSGYPEFESVIFYTQSQSCALVNRTNEQTKKPT